MEQKKINICKQYKNKSAMAKALRDVFGGNLVEHYTWVSKNLKEIGYDTNENRLKYFKEICFTYGFLDNNVDRIVGFMFEEFNLNITDFNCWIDKNKYDIIKIINDMLKDNQITKDEFIILSFNQC